MDSKEDEKIMITLSSKLNLGLRNFGSFTALLAMTSLVSFGQGEDEMEELEEFTVEGYREGKSLALQEKQIASNIKDIISADSIGNLPDQNVADALVRLPGVSIDMEQGEGRFVSIRGIAPELNNVTINGASIANPSVGGRAGRAVPLDIIGSSQVRLIEVIKSVTPDMDAQGLGGTVNLVTASGFDRDQAFFNGSVEGGFNSMTGQNGQEDDVERRLHFTYGNRLGANKGIGVALSANYEFRPFQTEAVDIRFRDNFESDTDGDGELESELVLPNDIEIVPEFGTRERFNLSGKLEFRPNEETEVFLTGMYSSFTEYRDEVEDIFEVEREAYFVSPDTAFAPYADTVQLRRFDNEAIQKLINFTVGAKKVVGDMTLSGEITYAYQQEEDDEQNIQFRGRRHEVQPGWEPITSIDGVAIPAISSLCGGDGVCEEGERIPVLMSRLNTSEPHYSLGGLEDTALDLIPHRRNQINTNFSEENTIIPKFDVRWDTENFLGSGYSGFLKVGVKYFDRERFVDDNVHRTGGADVTLADIPNATTSGRQVLSYNTGAEMNFDAIFNDFWGGKSGNINNLPVDEGAILSNSVEDDYRIDEKIMGLYGMFSVDIGDRLTVLGGVRFEDTEVDLTANQFTEGEFDGDALSECTGGGADGGCVNEVSGAFDYSGALPNLQLRYAITENLILRAAYTSTIGRPDFEDAAPISVFEWEIDDDELLAEAALKNPMLEPYESDNFDVSLEYYSDNGGNLALAVFHKSVDNPIFEFGFSEEELTVSEAQQVALETAGSSFTAIGLDGSDFITEVEFEGFDNAQSGKITGVELSGYFPLSFLPGPLDGLGIDGNVSLIDSSVDVIGREDEGLPFFQQPDLIANLTILYQRNRLEARLAYRYQDSELDELGGSAALDRWRADRSQWDAQINYRFSDHWRVFGRFQNLTNETDDATHGDNPLTLKDREDFGTTYRFGVSWNY